MPAPPLPPSRPAPPAPPKPAPPSKPVQGPRPAPPDLSKLPKVSAIEVQFHTNSDDLDSDTQLVVDFRIGNSVFASVQPVKNALSVSGGIWSVITWNFSSNQDTDWITVPIQSPVFKVDIHNGTTRVTINPVGNDTWRFNYWVRLHYSDSTMDEYHYDNHALSQDVRENTFPLK